MAAVATSVAIGSIDRESDGSLRAAATIVGCVLFGAAVGLVLVRRLLRGIRRDDPVRRSTGRPSRRLDAMSLLVGTLGLVGAVWLARSPLPAQVVFLTFSASFFALLAGAGVAIRLIR